MLFLASTCTYTTDIIVGIDLYFTLAWLCFNAQCDSTCLAFMQQYRAQRLLQRSIWMHPQVKKEWLSAAFTAYLPVEGIPNEASLSPLLWAELMLSLLLLLLLGLKVLVVQPGYRRPKSNFCKTFYANDTYLFHHCLAFNQEST